MTRIDDGQDMCRAVDTVVIGGGQAGLNTCRALQLAGADHVVLERGRIGETWRTQRWESFRVNTPNWANRLLGDVETEGDPDGFADAAQLADSFVEYAERHALPVHEQSEVTAVKRTPVDFVVETSAQTWAAANVVVCSGAQNVPSVPALAGSLPAEIDQLHAAEYRSPDRLRSGAVLVVGGGGQTGGQIAQELAGSGRTTYLCTSAVGCVPRRYRGRDIAAWSLELGITSTRVDELEDPDERYATQPLLSGVNRGHTMSLEALGRSGVVLLGRLHGVADGRLEIGGELSANAAIGQNTLRGTMSGIDAFIEASGCDAQPAEDDPALEPFPGLVEMAARREVALGDGGVSTVIWATGLTGNYSYLDFDIGLDEHGVPAHHDGASPIEGLYYVGFPWLRTRSSGLIVGSGDDAQAICDLIVSSRVRSSPRPAPLPV